MPCCLSLSSSRKKAEFRGLVKAYNLGMQEKMAKGLSVDQAHEMVQKNMENNPTFYTNTHTLAQFGNLLENNDCDGSNPHCLNKTVFWKSMKKSYKYQNHLP
jgi:hypothetical protein